MKSISNQRIILLLGDVATVALVTLFGFSTHGELDSAGAHMLTTFLPTLFAWLLVGPMLGAYEPGRAADARQLWRPFYAMVLAGPLAAWMRGAYLNRPIVPIFVVVLGGISAVALLAWRVLFWVFIGRKSERARAMTYG